MGVLFRPSRMAGFAFVAAVIAAACANGTADGLTRTPTSDGFEVVPGDERSREEALTSEAEPGGDTAIAEPSPAPGLDLLDDELTGFLKAVESTWDTDFSIHTVPFAEIRPGGPPRDGIPPIDDPVFAPVGDAPDYLVDAEPVIVLELNGEQRAYPLSILITHEIVNDVVAGEPVAVTYCPLCNTGLVFRRTVDGEVIRFGTTGLLYVKVTASSPKAYGDCMRCNGDKQTTSQDCVHPQQHCHQHQRRAAGPRRRHW